VTFPIPRAGSPTAAADDPEQPGDPPPPDSGGDGSSGGGPSGGGSSGPSGDSGDTAGGSGGGDASGDGGARGTGASNNETTCSTAPDSSVSAEGTSTGTMQVSGVSARQVVLNPSAVAEVRPATAVTPSGFDAITAAATPKVKTGSRGSSAMSEVRSVTPREREAPSARPRGTARGTAQGMRLSGGRSRYNERVEAAEMCPHMETPLLEEGGNSPGPRVETDADDCRQVTILSEATEETSILADAV